MNNEIIKECNICYSKKIQKKRVTCNSCSNKYCVGCYIRIFRKNKGLIICPYCNFTFGERVPDYLIDLGVMEIKDKSNGIKRNLFRNPGFKGHIFPL